MTARRPAAAVAPPPDLVVMRDTAATVLDEDTRPEEQAALAAELVAHLHELVPQVEELVPARLTMTEQYCALACLGEAHRKLSQEASPGPGGQAAHARRLARVLVALAAHWETLSDAGPAPGR
ncbi:DUF6415 family natural product biosynthesis protein [Streptomyces sp. DSM 41014]|uniref:DUF6415 family natural product biosynthesis protein n=1 Tax=Streptomyces hintoniae TaxID=3075521 RepID=A0ABU2UVU7_9ACTN|nr:DUF6415 family natural product biosynthesis protein [Streptomyces sp. DSM 41014]MDT0477426.1 DUF6415 family natural product biosynthesis protein [Streptomyces sp. DSM 41014]